MAVGTYKNSVPANILAYLQVPVVNRPLVQQHFMEPQPLSPYIGDAMKIYKPPDKYMAHASNRISILSAKKHLALDDLPFAICSKESFRAATGLRNITGSSYLRHKVRLASLCVQKCRTQRWLLEYKIGKSHDTHRFLLALDCDRNDETPLTVRALSAILDQVTNQPVKPQVAADEESMNFDAMLRSIYHDLPSLMNDSATKSVCKLLNSELTWAVVTEQLSDLTLQSFRGDTISWSQHLDKNSAAVMVQAERERCASSKWAALAKLYVRVTCHDRYKATYKTGTGDSYKPSSRQCAYSSHRLSVSYANGWEKARCDSSHEINNFRMQELCTQRTRWNWDAAVRAGDCGGHDGTRTRPNSSGSATSRS